MSVHESMANVIKAVGAIAKISSRDVSYKFRGIDDVMNALHKPLADFDLYLAPRVLDDWQLNMIPGTKDRTQSQALFRVCVDVYHKDGSMVTLGPGLAQSHDYGDKAVYQAQQNAIKYLLLTAFCVPTGDVDMDGVQADPVPSEEVAARGTNKLKSEALELMGDATEAKNLYDQALRLVGVKAEPVPVEFQEEVRKKILELAP